jgi:hypothetical protein
MITWTKRLLLTLTFLALIATNILSLTSTAFNAALAGLMGTSLGGSHRHQHDAKQTHFPGQDHQKTSSHRHQAQSSYQEIRHQAGQQNQASGCEEYCSYSC